MITTFRPALLSSLLLGLAVSLSVASPAEARDNERHGKVVAKHAIKPVTKTAKAASAKARKGGDKVEKQLAHGKSAGKKVTATTARAGKSAKAARVTLASSRAERESLRKERTRAKLARVSRTGKIAQAARYAAKPTVVVPLASAAPAVASVVSPSVSIGSGLGLNVESRAALVMNAATGEVLYSKNTDRALPIASITKLMTVMVVLDAHLPLDEPITISDADVDRMRNTTSRLKVGTVLSRAELMLLALMSSENRAAAALARTYPGGTPAAIAAMNRKASTIGMSNTRFYDGTGLNSGNTASPKDLVTMVETAYTYPLIRRFSTTSEHAVAIDNRIQQFHNTNALVKNPDWEIGVSKTGFINEAGKCLVMQAKIKSAPVVIVLMDSAGKYTRIGDAQRVKRWLESATN